jgi:putative membrane protein
MIKIIIKWLILSISVFASGYFVAGIVVADYWVALLAGAILLLINILVKPIVKILTLPLTIISFGLFGLILNAIFFIFVSQLIGGFSVVGFIPALYGSILVSILVWLSDKILN